MRPCNGFNRANVVRGKCRTTVPTCCGEKATIAICHVAHPGCSPDLFFSAYIPQGMRKADHLTPKPVIQGRSMRVPTPAPRKYQHVVVQRLLSRYVMSPTPAVARTFSASIRQGMRKANHLTPKPVSDLPCRPSSHTSHTGFILRAI